MNSKVTEYIVNQEKWTQELQLLRSFLLELNLEEAIKWGMPAYLYKGKNILGMSAFKNYVGLWFHQGVFLKDEKQLLLNAQEGKTKAMRQWRFNSIEEIDKSTVLEYVLEAMKNVDIGNEIKPVRNKKPLEIPSYLANAFEKDQDLYLNFNELTLTKKREFTDYISEAKRETTKESRLQKIVPMIKNGIGLHDKYR